MTPETAQLAAQATPVMNQTMVILLYVLLARSAVWKGIALRKAGSKKQMTWFICLFIFNTVGILPIIYLAFFQKKEKGKK